MINQNEYENLRNFYQEKGRQEMEKVNPDLEDLGYYQGVIRGLDLAMKQNSAKLN